MQVPLLLVLLAERQHGVVTRSQAVACGLARPAITRRLAAGVFEAVWSSCLRLRGQPVTWRQGLMVGLLDLGEDALVAGRAAAALLALDGFEEGPLEFVVPRGQRRRSTLGVVCSSVQLPLIDRADVDGFRCTSAARTIVDLAGRVGAPLLENAIDSALRRGLTSETFLRRRLRLLRRSGCAGVRALDQALDGAGGHSYLERRFLRVIADAGLPRPECQRVFRDGGRFVARTDFTFPPPARCIVEVAGHATHATRQQRAHDAQRQAELQLLGYLVLTFTYEHVVERPQWVVQVVRAALGTTFLAPQVSPSETWRA